MLVFIVLMGFFLPLHTRKVFHQCEPAPEPLPEFTESRAGLGGKERQSSPKSSPLPRAGTPFTPGYSEVTPGIRLSDPSQAGAGFPQVPGLSVGQSRGPGQSWPRSPPLPPANQGSGGCWGAVGALLGGSGAVFGRQRGPAPAGSPWGHLSTAVQRTVSILQLCPFISTLREAALKFRAGGGRHSSASPSLPQFTW